MPSKCYDHESSKLEGWIFDDKLFFISKQSTMRLIPHDLVTKEYKIRGKFEDAIVEFPEYLATGITGIHAIQSNFCIPDGTDIRFQISTDGGFNYQIYDGTDWVAAGVNDFVSVEVMNQGLPELPIFPKKSFRLKMKMFASSDGKKTPIIFGLSVTFDLCYNPREDLKRSLKRFVENHLNAKLKWARKIAVNSFIFTLETIINIKEIIAVYNITKDPDKVNNIFNAFNPINNEVSVTEEILMTEVIFVEYRGCPRVYVGVDHDFKETELPAIVIDIPSVMEQRVFKSAAQHNESGKGSEKAKLRQCPFVKDNSTTVYCLSANDIECYAISDALDRLLIDVVKVPSLATGYQIPIVNYKPLNDIDNTKNGLHVKTSTFVSVSIEPNENFEEHELVKEVNIDVDVFFD